MKLSYFLLPSLIIASAMLYAVLVGRSQAGRLRSLQMDLADGRLRGFAVIAVVIAMILASAFL